MRFLHQSIDSLLSFITIHNLRVCLNDVAGARPSKLIQTEGIEAYFKETYNYHGSGPRDFIVAGTDISLKPLSLGSAVAEIEARGGTYDAIIVGYNDGGVISVSKHRLAFQVGEIKADWWQPN